MKRAIFVRSKMTIMAELEKRAREKGIYKVTLWGSFANFLLVIFKFLAGIAGHSAAMMADAVHSLSDFWWSYCLFVFPISLRTRDMITATASMRLWLLP